MNATESTHDLSGAVPQPTARYGLAIARITVGAMFVSVFFENLGKGLYTASGYQGLINYYIQHDHAPAIWKSVMGLAASHASMAAPLQGFTEITLGVLLVLGLFSRPAALVALGLHQLDLGAFGSNPGRAWSARRPCWPHLGHRRDSRAPQSEFDLVVDAARSKSQAACYGGDSHAK
jgi:uncharacterized membrane protein YphA (DoxX/SURF4 family)